MMATKGVNAKNGDIGTRNLAPAIEITTRITKRVIFVVSSRIILFEIAITM